MMKKIKRTALVVGAGPGGSTAAYYLAKLGVDVLFVDKETWPRDKICGGVYVPALYPILKEMGCYDEMMKYQACSITDFRLIDRDEDYVDMKTEPAMIATRRYTDDQIRRAAIRMGADFMENYEATSLIIRKGVVKGVHGLYHNQEMDIEADVVVIANMQGGPILVQTSADGENWSNVGEEIAATGYTRMWKKYTNSYNGTDEVYVRVAQETGTLEIGRAHV